ncbi:MAG: DUF1016 domain-containing protein [Acidobacteria bacterium]|nr:DUF1016 domain-containing protein [Acidobacteriota bacterium]
MTDDLIPVNSEYETFFHDLKAHIQQSQIRTVLGVNRELVMLYWHIGCEIQERQKRQGWGAKIIDRLAADLSREFPEMKGFSSRNLKYMRALAEAYPDEQFVQQLVAQIPWGHNLRILEGVKSPVEREWYVRQTIENGWSRNVLTHQIESRLYHRQGQAITNFTHALPATQSELAHQILKDPYNFDFLSLGKDAYERDLERGLLEYIGKFLTELGVGFAFVGSHYRLTIGNFDFYLDLLFYHTKLHCYVAVDLKIGEFEPEFAGKMNFYLSALDDRVKGPEDNPSIGLILCKSQDKTIAEYALRDMAKPLGVATYQIVEAMPEQYHRLLPQVEEIEQGLTSEIDWDVFTPRPTYWFESEVAYEGHGEAIFSTPEGKIEGPVIVRFNEFGQPYVEMKVEKIETPVPLTFGLHELLSGQSPIHRPKKIILMMGAQINNVCVQLDVKTAHGLFHADGNVRYGYSSGLTGGTGKVIFYPSWSQYDSTTASSPRYWVLPLINFLTDFGQHHEALDSHPLRVFPTPRIPPGLSAHEKAMAQFQANSKNKLVIFEFSGSLGFIEALPEYQEKSDQLLAKQVPMAVTAMMVGELGTHSIDFPRTSEQKVEWFPGRFLDLLGLATGVQVGIPWVEFRDSNGKLIRRLHLPVNPGAYQRGQNVLGPHNYQGLSHLLTRSWLATDVPGALIHVSIRHILLGGSYEQHLEEKILFLHRAVRSLYDGLLKSSVPLVEALDPKQSQKIQKLLVSTAKKIQSMTDSESDLSNQALTALAAYLLDIKNCKEPLELVLARLFEHFDIPDVEILNRHYQENPRPDGLQWLQVVAKYCMAPLEDGYFHITEKRHDLEDVVKIGQHLHDILVRIMLKLLKYDFEYNPTVIASVARFPVDWVNAETTAEDLGYE